MEKAIAMREVPFMKATEALEFSTTLQKVQNELKLLIPRERPTRRKLPQKPLGELQERIKTVESVGDMYDTQTRGKV